MTSPRLSPLPQGLPSAARLPAAPSPAEIQRDFVPRSLRRMLQLRRALDGGDGGGISDSGPSAPRQRNKFKGGLPKGQHSRGDAVARDSVLGGAQKRKRGAADAASEEARRGQVNGHVNAAGSMETAAAHSGTHTVDGAEDLARKTEPDGEDMEAGGHEQKPSTKRQKASADTGDERAARRSGARPADKVLDSFHAQSPTRQCNYVAAVVLGHSSSATG